MSMRIDRSSETRLWLHELAFSVYLSLLFVWFEESRKFGWPYRYVKFWRPRATAMSKLDFLIFYFELFLILTATVFLALTLIERLPPIRKLVRLAGGILAFAGFPLICFYGEENPLLLAALVAGGICFLLWVRHKWFGSASLNTVLLIVYYAFCWFIGGKAPLEDRPVEAWTMWDYGWIVYVAVGVLYALIWATYFRQTEMQRTP